MLVHETRRVQARRSFVPPGFLSWMRVLRRTVFLLSYLNREEMETDLYGLLCTIGCMLPILLLLPLQGRKPAVLAFSCSFAIPSFLAFIFEPGGDEVVVDDLGEDRDGETVL